MPLLFCCRYARGDAPWLDAAAFAAMLAADAAAMPPRAPPACWRLTLRLRDAATYAVADTDYRLLRHSAMPPCYAYMLRRFAALMPLTPAPLRHATFVFDATDAVAVMMAVRQRCSAASGAAQLHARRDDAATRGERHAMLSALRRLPPA